MNSLLVHKVSKRTREEINGVMNGDCNERCKCTSTCTCQIAESILMGKHPVYVHRRPLSPNESTEERSLGSLGSLKCMRLMKRRSAGPRPTKPYSLSTGSAPSIIPITSTDQLQPTIPGIVNLLLLHSTTNLPKNLLPCYLTA